MVKAIDNIITGAPLRDIRLAIGPAEALLQDSDRPEELAALSLEDQLCGFQTGGGYAGPGRSPDRGDACVWAVAALLEGIRTGREPGVRVV